MITNAAYSAERSPLILMLQLCPQVNPAAAAVAVRAVKILPQEVNLVAVARAEERAEAARAEKEVEVPEEAKVERVVKEDQVVAKAAQVAVAREVQVVRVVQVVRPVVPVAQVVRAAALEVKATQTWIVML